MAQELPARMVHAGHLPAPAGWRPVRKSVQPPLRERSAAGQPRHSANSIHRLLYLISGRRHIGGSKGRHIAATVGALAVAAALVPTVASAHIERASYWPDPGVDFADGQPAGGAVPATRSLFSALDPQPVGDTLVVCQNDSIQRLDAAVAKARAEGATVRPSEQPEPFTAADAKAYKKFNRQLLTRCQYHEIQPAVNAAGNNDRVVVMPGVYDEPTSRSAPTNDPRCEGLKEEKDKGQTGALSYRYQATCPNDQNLVTIIGRESGPDPPQPPAWDRHGIPDNGPCIRCNLQLEGSGPGPDDVVIDAGRVASGNGAPPDPVKDIVIRAERADGLVIRNLTARHAAEHGIYVVETDGQRLARFKAFYNEEYGVLTFNADHALMQDCEAVGAGDAALYPGSSADVGEETIEATPRLGNEI